MSHAGTRLPGRFAGSGFRSHRVEINNLRAKLGSAIPQQAPIERISASTADANAVDEIDKALSAATKLQFDYHNVSRDDLIQRTVSPLRVESVNGIDQLRAYCHTSEGWRTFRLVAMSQVQALTEPADFPETAFQPMPMTEVELLVAKDRQELLEQFPGAAISHTTDGVVARVSVSQPAWLARLVQSSAGGIKVLAPADMAAAVYEQIDQALTVYRG